MKSPVLLITFNRPEHMRRVLSEVLKAHPKDLYIFQDGVREGNQNDIIDCSKVRDVINKMTECHEIRHHTFFPEKNLGCGPGPAAAITWFFAHEEQGIILEDDAVPHPDFFPYADELLDRYKDDDTVRAIGSMNVDTQHWGDGSYYFSMMNRNLCAWATWRRAWEDFDIKVSDTSRQHLNKVLKKYSCGLLERSYWCDRLSEVQKDGCGGKSWDIQFFISIWLHCGKGIIPNVNLSSNIGTVGDATHPMAAGNLIDNVPSSPILPLIHPTSTVIQHEADRQFHFRYFEPGKKNWSRTRIVYNLVNRSIKRLLGHKGPWSKRR